jgi:hypothetical protein
MDQSLLKRIQKRTKDKADQLDCIDVDGFLE